MRRRWILASALILITAVTLGGQTVATPTVGTGVIVGRVVDAEGGAAVTSAIVTLAGGGIGQRRVLVDPQGRFAFTELPAGAFNIAATKTGYLAGAFGKRRPDGGGQSLDLRDGERVTDATIKMWRFATISGTVTDDVDEPVPAATVQVLRRAIVAGRWRLVNSGARGGTDERGAYRVTGLVPGEYALVITSLIAAMPMSFAEVAESSRRMDPPAASELMRALQTNGSGGMANDVAQGFPTVRVGDMLLQLSSGAPTVNDDRTINIYPTVWYPSASTPAQGNHVTLRAGEQRNGIDLRTTLTTAVRVSGTVAGPDGPVPFLAMRLVPAALEDASAEITSSLALSFNVAMTVSDANGAFTFAAVPPGQYMVRAMTTPRPRPVDPPPAATVIQTADGMSSAVPSGPAPPPMLGQDPTLWTVTSISVGDTGVSGVTVTMRPGLRVTGRVEFDGAGTKPSPGELRAIRVAMDPADGRTVASPGAYQAQIDPAGAFYTTGLMAGQYLLRVDGPPRGWTLESAMAGGRDISDAPIALGTSDVTGLVLTFTDHPSGLAGTVRDGQGKADDTAAVLAFPVDSSWIDLGSSPRRLRNVRPSRAGAYAISGLPPGDYYVVAIGDESAGNWQDPALLRRLAAVAARVTITAGQTRTADLTTAVLR